MTALYVAIGLGAGLLVLGVSFVAVQVEDWSRDLTTNTASTADDAADERLRPVHSKLPPAELAAHVEAATCLLKDWRLQAQNESAGAIELHFVRTTPVLRFRDDIRVTITAADGGSRLTAESRSRVGKGDLGQNHRNLRELLDAVRAAAG
jgi:uncharacterized protein (DUF1499 family)